MTRLEALVVPLVLVLGFGGMFAVVVFLGRWL